MQLSQQAVLIRVKRFMWCIPIAKKGEEGRRGGREVGVGRQRSGRKRGREVGVGSKEGREGGREEGRKGGRKDQDTPK